MRMGAIYRISCQICQSEGQKTYYVGETARTPYDRGIEHLKAISKGNEESPMVEHHLEDHLGTEPSFKMEILRYPKTTLLRQVSEGVLIDENFKNPAIKVMNRKGEWGQHLPPKLSIEGEDQPKTARKRTQRQTNDWHKGAQDANRKSAKRAKILPNSTEDSQTEKKDCQTDAITKQPAKIQNLEKDKGPQIMPPNCQIPPVESADVQRVRAKHCKRVGEVSVKEMMGYMRKQSSENSQCAKAKPCLSENMRKRAQGLPENCSTQGSNCNAKGKENLGTMGQVRLDYPSGHKRRIRTHDQHSKQLTQSCDYCACNFQTPEEDLTDKCCQNPLGSLDKSAKVESL